LDEYPRSAGKREKERKEERARERERKETRKKKKKEKEGTKASVIASNHGIISTTDSQRQSSKVYIPRVGTATIDLSL
jgi:hypothetical protein